MGRGQYQLALLQLLAWAHPNSLSELLDEETAINRLPPGYIWDLITKSDRILRPVKLQELMLSQDSKGNTKIVTDFGDTGRKKGVQGGKEEEAGQENWVAPQEIKQTRWGLIDCFHELMFFAS